MAADMGLSKAWLQHSMLLQPRDSMLSVYRGVRAAHLLLHSRRGRGEVLADSQGLQSTPGAPPGLPKFAWSCTEVAPSVVFPTAASGCRKAHTCCPRDAIAMRLVLTCCARARVQAAGAIHTDFERGFICAEVMHYDELKELGSEAAVKAAGKYRQEGESVTIKTRPVPIPSASDAL